MSYCTYRYSRSRISGPGKLDSLIQQSTYPCPTVVHAFAVWCPCDVHAVRTAGNSTRDSPGVVFSLAHTRQRDEGIEVASVALPGKAEHEAVRGVLADDPTVVGSRSRHTFKWIALEENVWPETGPGNITSKDACVNRSNNVIYSPHIVNYFCCH